MMDPQTKLVVNPLAIILVKKGSKGDRLLFRYPYKCTKRESEGFNVDDSHESFEVNTPVALTPGGPSILISNTPSTSGPSLPTDGSSGGNSKKGLKATPPASSRRNPYTPTKSPNDSVFYDDESEKTSVPRPVEKNPKFALGCQEMLNELTDEDLANLLAVNTELCETKFELKVNQLRFVGNPSLINDPNRPSRFETSVRLFHVVFCLHASASHSIVKCYFELSKKIAIGIRHEQNRCGYFGQELKAINRACDEAHETRELDDEVCKVENSKDLRERIFDTILCRSSLARTLKAVYDDVCGTGYTFVRINDWVQVSFCIPQRIHFIPFRKEASFIEPREIHRCLEVLRPYHAILLLVEKDEILSHLSMDSSSTILRVLQVYSPLKNLQTLAADADITLSHIIEVSSHLVYWAYATIIYPLCEANIYIVAPDLCITSTSMENSFNDAFPGLSLSQTLSDFSQPIPLGERINPVLGGTYLQMQLIQLVIWMLKHNLLIQLHTYVYLSTNFDNSCDDMRLDRFSISINPDISLNMKESTTPFEQDEESVSGSFSEAPLPDSVKSSTPVIESEPDSISSVSNFVFQGGKNIDSGDKASQTNNNEEASEPLENFKELLASLKEPVKRAVVTVMGQNSVSVQDVRLFARLSNYFNGKFHVEEIMFRENIRRSQLMLCLDKFQKVIILVEKDDMDVNVFDTALS